MKRKEEIKAKGKEQSAKSEGQRAEGLIAVDFIQRIKEYNVRNGLQPHSMWLKPVFDFNYSARQLKQTAKDSAANSALTNENSTVFHKPQSPEETSSTGGEKNSGGKRSIIDLLPEEIAIRACDLLRIFNN